MFKALMNKLGRYRIINDRKTGAPYLERYYLFLKDRDTFPFNVFLHKFVKSDPDDLHDHPWNYSTFIIKEANTPSHVSWHQDLTYWGFSHDDQVSVWLALSPANELSGAMQMIPESHTSGMIEHITTKDKNNVLLQGQKVDGVNEKNATLCPLLPGEASFHHGWTIHSSMPNNSNDRRIGFNIQYIATHVKQMKNNTILFLRRKEIISQITENFPS